MNSLAAYSLVCYFLQIKDRHNGNIMLDEQGSLLHIDFGYLLARTIKFEKAPFKLTEEMMEVIGGEKSKLFKRYVELLVQGFLAIRLHYEKILMLVEMTLVRRRPVCAAPHSLRPRCAPRARASSSRASTTRAS